MVERVEDDVAWVRDADGVERAISNDRDLQAGDTVKLVLDEDGSSVVRVLDA